MFSTELGSVFRGKCCRFYDICTVVVSPCHGVKTSTQQTVKLSRIRKSRSGVDHGYRVGYLPTLV